jgi:hypothetical protein
VVSEDGTEARAAVDLVGADWAAAAALYDPELADAAVAPADANERIREADRARSKAERKLERLADAPTVWLRTFLRRRLRGGPP